MQGGRFRLAVAALVLAATTTTAFVPLPASRPGAVDTGGLRAAHRHIGCSGSGGGGGGMVLGAHRRRRRASWGAAGTFAAAAGTGAGEMDEEVGGTSGEAPAPEVAAAEGSKPLKKPTGTPVKKRSTGTDTLTIPKDAPKVGAPQAKVQSTISLDTILQELQAIQNTGPQKYCILGTRHCSYLHQQIIELLSYALVLTGNHIFTSGSPGTNAAAIRGALRAERPDLLTVVLPQSLSKQPTESQELLEQVEDVIENARNDHLSLDVASRLCNSDLLSRADQLIGIAFHDSSTVIEATREAAALEKVVTVLYLD